MKLMKLLPLIIIASMLLTLSGRLLYVSTRLRNSHGRLYTANNRSYYFPETDGTHHNELGRHLLAKHIADELF